MSELRGEGLVPILVVDDQEAFREIMRDLVAATPGFEIVGEAVSGEDALAAVEELSPELVIMDVRMPGIGGIEATRRVCCGHSDVSVILISVEPLDNLPACARDCGAVAFVRKQDLSPRKIRELWSQRVGV